MSGAIASVILRSPFTVAQTGLVSQLLHDRASDVTETRKGRHWDFTDGRSRATLTVFETHGRPDCHDDLLDAGLTTDDAPEIVVIAYPSKTDRDACGRLAVLVADLLDGLNRGVGDG
ncbi:hypothetical protein Poly51_40480 [Rubripirellula tenax]|uniref:Uncharacterized protein n=1 Tax=Rubripirellula tenax TaxID=2528015 RepID=A0A5C6EQ51_9BACT|nr:DUF6368 family protein [Rubripirellula tenax]TWU50755.1 hypothetical protein Poly51_40480 [Rubripirellula tenax]